VKGNAVAVKTAPKTIDSEKLHHHKVEKVYAQTQGPIAATIATFIFLNIESKKCGTLCPVNSEVNNIKIIAKPDKICISFSGTQNQKLTNIIHKNI
jgi:hypothetical protein